jgi:hypothetical protein
MHTAAILQPVKVLTPEEKASARWAAFLADPDAWLDQRAAKVAAVVNPQPLCPGAAVHSVQIAAARG